MIIKPIDELIKFITEYFVNRSSESVFRCLDKNIIWSSNGFHKVANGIEEVMAVINKEMEQQPYPYIYNIENLCETIYSEELVAYSCNIELTISQLDINVNMQMNYMLKKDKDNRFKFISCSSFFQKEGQINEVDYLKSATEERIQNAISDVYDDSVYGGFIGTYYDRDLSLYFISDKFAKYLGYSSSKEFKLSVNNKYLNCIETNNNEIGRKIIQAIDKNETKQYEYRIRKKNGQYIEIVDTSTTLITRKGEKIRASFIKDISEEKLAEKKMQEAIENAQIAIDNSGTNYWLYDFKNNKIKPINVISEHSNFISEYENYPKCLLEKDLIYIEDRKKYQEEVDKIKYGKVDETEFTVRSKDKYGKYSWRRLRFEIVKDNNGKRQYAVGTSRVYNDEKKFEELVSVIFEQVGLVSWTYDIENKILKVISNKNEDSFEYLENVPNCFLESEFIEGKENTKKAVNLFENINNGEMFSQEELLLKDIKTGESKWYITSMTVVEWLNGKPKTAIGSMYETTDSVMLKERFDSLINIESLDNNYVKQSCELGARSSIIWNLSKDELCSQKGFDWIINKIKLNERTFNNYLKVVQENVSSVEEAENFTKKFNKDTLMKMYSKGKMSEEVVYKYTVAEGDFWNRTIIHIIKNPRDGDLYVKIDDENITIQMETESLIKTIVDMEFDYLAHINFASDRCTILTSNPEYEIGFEHLKKITPVQEYVDLICKQMGVRKIQAKEFVENVIIKCGEKGCYQDNYKLLNGRIKRLSIKLLDKRRGIYTVIATDVTEISRSEQNRKQKLIDAMESANEANKLKSEFFARMSHDMRTPLNAIIGLSEFGIDERRDLHDVGYFRQIKESSEYLLGLLNDVLNMQKIETGKIQMHPEPVSVTIFLNNIMGILLPRAEMKYIDFNVLLNTDIWEYQKFDKLRVMQIELNIISNAIKYTQTGGKVFWKKWFYKTEENKGYFHNEVIDNGVGMGEEFVKTMFEPFTQEKNRMSCEEQGSGLGLAITKNLIEILGGKIWCESEVGKGTTMYFDLPVELISKEEYEAYEKEDPNLKELTLKGKSILLCEDNDINAKIIKRLLVKYGAKVKRANNGEIGVDLFNDNYFDAILMDIKMPIKDGLCAAKEIRLKDKYIPIIALSANAYDEDIRKSILAGMNKHLSKPIDSKELISVLCKEINK